MFVYTSWTFALHFWALKISHLRSAAKSSRYDSHLYCLKLSSFPDTVSLTIIIIIIILPSTGITFPAGPRTPSASTSRHLYSYQFFPSLQHSDNFRDRVSIITDLKSPIRTPIMETELVGLFEPPDVAASPRGFILEISCQGQFWREIRIWAYRCWLSTASVV